VVIPGQTYEMQVPSDIASMDTDPAILKLLEENKTSPYPIPIIPIETIYGLFTNIAED